MRARLIDDLIWGRPLPGIVEANGVVNKTPVLEGFGVHYIFDSLWELEVDYSKITKKVMDDIMGLRYYGWSVERPIKKEFFVGQLHKIYLRRRKKLF